MSEVDLSGAKDWRIGVDVVCVASADDQLVNGRRYRVTSTRDCLVGVDGGPTEWHQNRFRLATPSLTPGLREAADRLRRYYIGEETVGPVESFRRVYSGDGKIGLEQYQNDVADYLRAALAAEPQGELSTDDELTVLRYHVKQQSATIARLMEEVEWFHGQTIGGFAALGISTPEEGFRKARHCLPWCFDNVKRMLSGEPSTPAAAESVPAPKAVITGPGKYMTDGEGGAEIAGCLSGHWKHPWLGVMLNTREVGAWSDSGESQWESEPHRITGPCVHVNADQGKAVG